jgi:hypothetical protein
MISEVIMHIFEKALEESKYRAILDNQTDKLKEILNGRLLFPFNGGYFKIGPVLFSEIEMYFRDNKTGATLLDIYDNPIDIEDLDDFYKKCRQVYTFAIKSHKLAMKRLTVSRNIETMIKMHDLTDDTEE